MRNYLKRYGESVTGLRNNLFFKARLRLSLFYTLIVAVILVVVTILLYFSAVDSLSNATEGNFSSNAAQQEVVQQQRSQLAGVVAVVDVTVILLVGAASYWLAGETQKPIRNMLHAQKDFVANASHDLRTPLAVMRADVEMGLDEHSLPPRLKTLLESNIEEIDRMSSLVDGLLWLAQSESGAQQQRQLTDIVALEQRVLRLLDRYAVQKGITIRTHTSQKPIPVQANAQALERAFTNIVKNAIDYSPPQATVTVTVRQTARNIEFLCKDTGYGIDAKDLPHIFDRFYRADKARSKSQSQGSGLGLAIAQKVAQQHGGHITAESQVGQGTTIIITLPKPPHP
jgi:signal transduction histidine kinase